VITGGTGNGFILPALIALSLAVGGALGGGIGAAFDLARTRRLTVKSLAIESGLGVVGSIVSWTVFLGASRLNLAGPLGGHFLSSPWLLWGPIVFSVVGGIAMSTRARRNTHARA